MAVLIFAEATKGNYKKNALEAVYYGSKVAAENSAETIVFTIGDGSNAGQFGSYGADKIWFCSNENSSDTQVVSALIAQAAQKAAATHVIIAHTALGKAIAGRVAIKMDASLVSGVNALPQGNTIQKQVFSGKANAKFELKGDKHVLTVMGNTLKPEATGNDGIPEEISLNAPESRTKVLEVKTVEGTVPLPEAELVVSAGRGMKGPENWGMIDELAEVIGATTACSRPVADTGWRPHHEHVGQTGIAIRPNLYIAIGISGAIQHLAGVNNSKVIVVINKDPEAPFFKAADYGVLGDLFEVVPRLIESFKKFKAS